MKALSSIKLGTVIRFQDRVVDRFRAPATCPNQKHTSRVVPSQTLNRWSCCLEAVSCRAGFKALAPTHDALGVAIKWCSAQAKGTRELLLLASCLSGRVVGPKWLGRAGCPARRI